MSSNDISCSTVHMRCSLVHTLLAAASKNVPCDLVQLSPRSASAKTAAKEALTFLACAVSLYSASRVSVWGLMQGDEPQG